MDAETRARVFEPFFTTKPVGQGTGLGLATVYGIVKQSDGFIWAYGEPGHGAVFKIYLPEQSAIPTTTGEHAIPRDAPAGAERILLVEDEEAVRRMAARALSSRGYTILEAANGSEALDLVADRSTDIDLVVTDVIMPGVGGRELGERLTDLRPGLPVLFISGYTDDDVVRRGLLSPGSPFLQKPFEPDALARKVRQVIEHARR
jgi:CheY-like chemotaxis protein